MLGFFIWRRESGEALEPGVTKVGKVFSQSPADGDMSAFQHEVRPGGAWGTLDGMAREIREFLPLPVE